ncbi:MAG: NfeD family protein [Alphaproteobacteria bacterium]
MGILQITYAEWFTLGVLLFLIALIVRRKISISLSLGAMLTGLVVWGFTLYTESITIYKEIWLQLVIFFASFLLISFIFPGHLISRKGRIPSSKFRPKKGQVFVLPTPIVAGQALIEIEGQQWTIIGPDLPAGTSVVVSATEEFRIFVNTLSK